MAWLTLTFPPGTHHGSRGGLGAGGALRGQASPRARSPKTWPGATSLVWGCLQQPSKTLWEGGTRAHSSLPSLTSQRAGGQSPALGPKVPNRLDTTPVGCGSAGGETGQRTVAGLSTGKNDPPLLLLLPGRAACRNSGTRPSLPSQENPRARARGLAELPGRQCWGARGGCHPADPAQAAHSCLSVPRPPRLPACPSVSPVKAAENLGGESLKPWAASAPLPHYRHRN